MHFKNENDEPAWARHRMHGSSNKSEEKKKSTGGDSKQIEAFDLAEGAYFR
jgi:hypothetical protein